MASCTCGTCHSNCDGSGSNSGCTCVSGCGGGCESCSDSCGNGCKNSCSGDCDGSCSGGCSGSCSDSCKGSCSNSCKGGCDGGCTSCDGGCSGGCDGCSGGCSGCSGGCTSCSNACSSQDMRNAIANLGANIIAKGYIKAEDYLEIKNRLTQELKRRGKQSLDENFTNVPAKDGYTIPEHILRTYNAIYKFNPTYDFRSKAYSGAVIYIDDMDDVIYYIRQLLAQHIK